MTQEDRDRLVALKKAKKGLITQREAAGEIGRSERQVRRLLVRLGSEGDGAVVHGLRGRPSNGKLKGTLQQKATEILRRPVYAGFGPTVASEYLSQEHAIDVSRETVRGVDGESGTLAGQAADGDRDPSVATAAVPLRRVINGTPASTNGWRSEVRSSI